MSRRISNQIRNNVIGYAALFLALTGGVAWANHPGGADTISSGDIINEEVKSVDLKNGEVRNDDLAADSVGSGKIADRQVKNADLSIGASSSNTIADGGILGIDVKSNTLTGTQIDESTLFNDNSLTGADIDESTLSGVPSEPSGPAGGDLSGTYPNPQIGQGAVASEELATDAIPADGNIENASTKLAAGSVGFSELAQDSVDSGRVLDDSLSAADIDESTLPFWRLGGNAGTTAADSLGTTDNQPLSLRVNDARALRLEPASDGTNQSPNVIGGIADNSVTPGVHSATIGGGGRSNPADPATANEVTDDQGTVGGGADNRAGAANTAPSDGVAATVSGGRSNTASEDVATVGGGEFNAASGTEATVSGGVFNTASGPGAAVGGGGNNAASGFTATVGGGQLNTASQEGDTVAGGESNTASAGLATVGGGGSNIASGLGGATVPGGVDNTAAGDRSFAAGTRAKANHTGAFVWADSQFSDMASGAANQFIVRASGEFFLQSDSTLDDQGGFLNTSTGGFLSTGGAWTNASDERLKSRFERVEPRGVLERVAELPVRSWEYDAEPGIRHLGPTAQDFHRAFGLGNDERHIASVDADGVALAAIKGLSKEVDRLRRKLASLKQREESR